MFKKKCFIEITSELPLITGTNLTGNIVCEFNQPTSVESIKVNFHGEENTERMITRERHYGNSVLIDIDQNILDGGKVLEKGISKFPFLIEIPKRLPNSFKTQLGRIVYVLTATIKRGEMLKMNITDRKEIQIEAKVDLNTYLEALQIYADYSTDRAVSKFCGFSKGRIILHAVVEKRLFLLNEDIKVDISVVNLSSVKIRKIFARIMQSLTVYFNKPVLDSEITRTFVAKSTKYPGVKKHDESQFSLYIKVPKDLYVPNWKYSTLFKITYQIQIIAELSGCNTSMVLQFKIYLGHIPLTRQPSDHKRSFPFIRSFEELSSTSIKL